MELSDVAALLTAVAAAVLGAAGVTKVLDPRPTAHMLDAIGAPGGPATARIAGVVELLVALWLLADGSRWAASAGALVYLGLTIAVLVLRRRSPATPCGCFGRWSGPPTARHLVVNLLGVAALTLAAVAASPTGPPAGLAVTSTLQWWLVVAGGATVVILVLAGSRIDASSGPARARRATSQRHHQRPGTHPPHAHTPHAHTPHAHNREVGQ